jgi:hypothetical protein
MKMAASEKLVKLLKSNLDLAKKPEGYEKLREKLATIKPDRPAPTIPESPENVREIGHPDD